MKNSLTKNKYTSIIRKIVDQLKTNKLQKEFTNYEVNEYASTNKSGEINSTYGRKNSDIVITIKTFFKHQILNILEKFNFNVNTASNNSEFVDLAPTDNADEKGIYSSALKHATTSKNIKNIAITGPYGSGKSSIIKTFLKSQKKHALQISLAAFNSNDAPETDKSNKHEIERSILQQLLYGADANKLPLSRFKRIQSPNKIKSQFNSLIIMIGLLDLWYLIENKSIILNGKFFLPFNFSNSLNLSCIILGFILFWQAIRYIYVKSLGLSLKSLSLNSVELTPETAKEESILNRHLDEIIYFFQSTPYDLVIIEDLDRFNNTEIFVTLREINSLINANQGVKRTIRFLYALRDDMFKNTERTKFFEFIIPVIPIINSSNSIDKILENGARLSLNERLNRQFLREVSRYLNDLRLIQNIFNEYAIYVKNLESDNENNLDANKLLSVLIYKNIMPSDFEDLHEGKGILAEIFNKHDTYISLTEQEYNKQIASLEVQIDLAEQQLPDDLDQLRKIYAMTLINKIPLNYYYLSYDRSSYFTINELTSHPDFETIIEAKTIYLKNPNNNSHNLDISNLQKEVNSNNTYQQRKNAVINKANDYKVQILAKIQELRNQCNRLRLSKSNEIIRANSRETDELFKKFGDNMEILRFLVFEGYLDDTHYQYTSLFHKGRLSHNDNKFLIKIRSFINPEPDFQIDNPKEVIAEMRETDFDQNYCLNKILADELFSTPLEYQKEIAKFVKFISLNFKESEAFFLKYYTTGKYVSKFLTTLIEKWDEFVNQAISSPNNVTHVCHILAYVPEKYLRTFKPKYLGFAQYISDNLSNILALGIHIETSQLKSIQCEIVDLTTLEDYPAITKMLFEEGLYFINIKNIDFIFRTMISSPTKPNLENKHYTSVLASNNSILIENLEKNFGIYLENVLLRLSENSFEGVDTIFKVVNQKDINLDNLEQFLSNQIARLPTLDKVPTNLFGMIFRLKKVEPTWNNCLKFLSSDVFDAHLLTEYLKDESVIKVLSHSRIPAGNEALLIAEFILNNNDLPNDIYRSYIRMVPYKSLKFPNDIDEEKVRIIIEEKAVKFSKTNMEALKVSEELQALFIVRNIEEYLEIANTIEIDDDLRDQLLRSELSDENKLKIINDMDLSTIDSLPDRASIIGDILVNSNSADIKDLTPTSISALVNNSDEIHSKIYLLNKFQSKLSDNEIRELISNLPTPFNQIKAGWNTPRIDNNDANSEFVKWLKARNFISSWKVTKTIFSLNEEIKINLFRT